MGWAYSRVHSFPEGRPSPVQRTLLICGYLLASGFYFKVHCYWPNKCDAPEVRFCARFVFAARVFALSRLLPMRDAALRAQASRLGQTAPGDGGSERGAEGRGSQGWQCGLVPRGEGRVRGSGGDTKDETETFRLSGTAGLGCPGRLAPGLCQQRDGFRRREPGCRPLRDTCYSFESGEGGSGHRILRRCK
jgi:hypothetical protein